MINAVTFQMFSDNGVATSCRHASLDGREDIIGPIAPAVCRWCRFHLD
jgi:hypothetical protein